MRHSCKKKTGNAMQVWCFESTEQNKTICLEKSGRLTQRGNFMLEFQMIDATSKVKKRKCTQTGNGAKGIACLGPTGDLGTTEKDA